MGNEGARAQLAALAERLRGLPTALAHDLAPEAAEALRAELGANIRAGIGPDGEPWPLRKDGGRALQNAERALTVRAVGTVVLARLEGPEALHHKGRAKGHVQRLILPTGKLPAPFLRALTRAAGRRYAELVQP